MQTLIARASWLAIVVMGGATAGCIEARNADGQGQSAFIGGPPTSSLDYGAGGAGGAGAAPGGMGGGAGTIADMSSPPLNPMTSSGGSGGASGAAGMEASGGASGAAGMEASGGASGAAGMEASGGASGAAGMEASGGASGGSGAGASAGMLAIQFMSVGNAGEYAPRNVGAVWVETSSGTFVKTLERWAGIRANHLTTWTAASGGWGGGFFFATGNTADQMDAISAATLRPHRVHNATWNMKDAMGMIVPDGTYRVMIEVTESERKASAVAAVEFEKGPAPVSLSPADEGPFADLTLTYTP